MFIELEPIFNNVGEQKEFNFNIDLSNEEFDGIFPFKTPVMVAGVVKNSSGIVTLEYDVNLRYDGFCDRCAEEIERELSYSFEHTLVLSLNNEENDDLMLIEDLHFEVDPLAIEDIFLSLPTKILCSENCAGLCTKCGKNLNHSKCDCEKDIDPRLAILQQLLENDE